MRDLGAIEAIVWLVIVVLVVSVIVLLALVIRARRNTSRRTAARVGSLEGRMARVEDVLTKMATNDAVQALSMKIGRLEGQLEAVDGRMSRVVDRVEHSARTLDRLENYLMVATAQAIVAAKTRGDGDRRGGSDGNDDEGATA